MFEVTVHTTASVQHAGAATIAMISRLLAEGGRAVEAGGASTAAWVAAYGQKRPGGNARLIGGNWGMCHQNSIAIAARDPDLIHEYGYALSDDGCWYEHSWLFDGVRVVETTCLREMYVGVPVTKMPRAALSYMQGAEWLEENEAEAYHDALKAAMADLPVVDRSHIAHLITSAIAIEGDRFGLPQQENELRP